MEVVSKPKLPVAKNENKIVQGIDSSAFFIVTITPTTPDGFVNLISLQASVANRVGRIEAICPKGGYRVVEKEITIKN